MKPRARVNPISKKRAAAHPELLRGNSTIVRSSSQTPQQTPIPRSRIKPKKRSEAERVRIYGTDEKQEWMREQPCHFCGVVGHTQICHATNGGRGRKDDAERTFPACGPHYANLHLKYFPGFPNLVEGCHAASVKLSRDERLAIAAEYEALWQAHAGGVA